MAFTSIFEKKKSVEMMIEQKMKLIQETELELEALNIELCALVFETNVGKNQQDNDGNIPQEPQEDAEIN
jgi:hypothetical protein